MTFIEFTDGWKLSSKKNFYKVIDNIIYVISNIDYDTKEEQTFYHVVKKIEHKNYEKMFSGEKDYTSALQRLFYIIFAGKTKAAYNI